MKCQHEETNVIDTQTKRYPGTVKRRRKCKKCGVKWSTYEVPEKHYKALQRIKDYMWKVMDE